jgi:hypothetical protein
MKNCPIGPIRVIRAIRGQIPLPIRCELDVGCDMVNSQIRLPGITANLWLKYGRAAGKSRFGQDEDYRFTLHVRCDLFRISVCRTAPDSYAHTHADADSGDSWDSWKRAAARRCA